MKINELTNDQLAKIAYINPEWVADNRPEWMADNRPNWMADNWPNWMAENRPNWMAENRPWMAKNYPEIYAKYKTPEEVPADIMKIIEN